MVLHGMGQVRMTKHQCPYIVPYRISDLGRIKGNIRRRTDRNMSNDNRLVIIDVATFLSSLSCP